MQGRSINSPIYDFSTHSRLKQTKKINPCKIIILEGILIFTQKELLDLINLKVFISAYSELSFSRRLKRDVEERGRTIQEVTTRYFKDVLPEDFTEVRLMLRSTGLIEEFPDSALREAMPSHQFS